MFTRPVVVVQTQAFLRQAMRVWTEEELDAFVDYIAMNASAAARE